MAALAPHIALAHPGHGDPRLQGSMLHVAVEPVHGPAIALLIGIFAWALYRLKKRPTAAID